MSYNKVFDQTYITNDYDHFTFKGGNRDIGRNERHIQELQHKLRTKQLRSIPIIVTKVGNKFRIIDGQNRFEALKREKLHVIYAIEKQKVTIQDIRNLNNLHKSWNQKDVVDSYIFSEKERFGDACHTKPYHMYKHFMLKHKVPSSVALFLLTGSSYNNKKVYDEFKNGRLQIPNWNKSTEKILFLKSMELFIDKKWKRASFVTAMITAYDDYRFRKKRWMRKLELNSRKLVLATNASDYMDMINEIYNFKETQKVYFELKNLAKVHAGMKRNGVESFWNH